MFNKKNLAIIIFSLSSNIALAQNLNWHDNDFIDQAQILKPDEQLEISNQLKQANSNSNLDLKILTVSKIETSLSQYCNELYKTINVIPETESISLVYNQQNNHILSCQPIKKSSQVTNEELYYILNDLMQPNIDNNNLSSALKIGIKNIDQANQTNILPKKTAEDNIEEVKKIYEIFIYLMIIIFLNWLAAWLGRTKQWWMGGIIGSGLGLFIWWLSQIWVFVLIFGLFGLIYDYLVSLNYKKYQKCEKGGFWCYTEFNIKKQKNKRH